MRIRHLFLILSATLSFPALAGQPWSAQMEQAVSRRSAQLAPPALRQRAEGSRGTGCATEPKGARNEEYGAYSNSGFCSNFLATNGRIVLLSNGLNVTIIPVDDPEHPIAWDIPFFDIYAYPIKMVGDMAYSLTLEGLQSWDLTDPAHPSHKRDYRQCGPYYYTDFAIVGHYALLSGNHLGIGVLDLDGDGVLYEDSLVSGPPEAPYSGQIVTAGHYALVTDGATYALACYDITDPGHPVALWGKAVPAMRDAYPVIYEPPYLIVNYQTPKNPGDAFTGPTQLGIFYLPDPGDPSSFDPRPVNAACPLTVPDYLFALSARWPMVYLSAMGGIEAVDLSNPASPQSVGSVKLNLYHPNAHGSYGIEVVGDQIFIAEWAGLTVFDLSLKRVSHLLTGSLVWGGFNYYKPFSLTPDGDLGLVNLANEGAVLIDFTSGRPKRLGTWENTVGAGAGFVNDSLLSDDGRYAYVATDDWTPGAVYRGKLNILDFADPSNPVKVGEYAFPAGAAEWFPTDLTRLDDHQIVVLMADNISKNYRMAIVDVARPTAPSTVGTFNFPPGVEASGLTIADGYPGGKRYAAVACGETADLMPRLINVNITDLEHPILALDTVLFARGYASSVAMVKAGGTPYAIVGSLDTLSAVDMSDPSNASTTVVKFSMGAYDHGPSYQTIRGIPYGGPYPEFSAGNGWGGDSNSTWLFSVRPGPFLYLEGNAQAYGDFFGADAAMQPVERRDGRLYNASFLQVGYYPHVFNYGYPKVAGPISVQQGQDITEPIQFTIEGVTDDVGISKVQYWIRPYSVAGCWQLMEVQRPTENQSTYTFTLDPTKVWDAGDRAIVRVEAYNTAGKMGFFDSDYINIKPTPPLDVQAVQSPSSGRAPLTVTYHATPTGGSGPYHIRWQFAGPWVNGNDVEMTFTEPGDVNWRCEVEDIYHQITYASGVTQVLPALSTPAISGYRFLKTPFRVRLTGSGIRLGCQVYISGTQVRWVTAVSEGMLTLGKGAELKALLPKRQGVPVVVVNPDGGQSAPIVVYR
jgi:hypothetical protein